MSVLSFDKEALARLCRSHGIRRLALFGSVPKGTARPDSDVDFLVEFEPDAVPGFLGLAEIEAELSGLLGRPVDLRTAHELSPHFRQPVKRPPMFLGR
jgi:predicted nucleotidyltransferase